MNELAELLIKNNISIGTVESFTVGNFATLMCVNGKSILDVDLCVSFTGNAGPDAMEGKPVGEVYIGIAYEDVVVYKLNLEGSRKEIALKAIDFAQKKIIEKILKK